MKIKVWDIKDDGIVVNDTLAAEYIGLTEKDHLHFIAPLKVHAKIEKFDATVLGHVKVNGRFTSFCYRTLEEVEQDFDSEFDVDIEITPQTEEVDLGDEIRQEVVLRIPDRVLSEEGKKLEDSAVNKDEGVEEAHPTYRPFSKLKNIK